MRSPSGDHTGPRPCAAPAGTRMRLLVPSASMSQINGDADECEKAMVRPSGDQSNVLARRVLPRDARVRASPSRRVSSPLSPVHLVPVSGEGELSGVGRPFEVVDKSPVSRRMSSDWVSTTQTSATWSAYRLRATDAERHPSAVRRPDPRTVDGSPRRGHVVVSASSPSALRSVMTRAASHSRRLPNSFSLPEHQPAGRRVRRRGTPDRLGRCQSRRRVGVCEPSRTT